VLGEPILQFFSFLSFRKMRVKPLSPILQKYYSFWEYFNFKTTLFIASKNLEVFDT
jgi:hypothetical protein